MALVFNGGLVKAEETPLNPPLSGGQEQGGTEGIVDVNQNPIEQTITDNEVLQLSQSPLEQILAGETLPSPLPSPTPSVVGEGETQAGQDTATSTDETQTQNPPNPLYQGGTMDETATTTNENNPPDPLYQGGTWEIVFDENGLIVGANQTGTSSLETASSTPETPLTPLDKGGSSTPETASTSPQPSPYQGEGVSGNTAPRLIGMWQMNDEKNTDGLYLGTDDNTQSGAQFMPSGIYEVNKNIGVCALAADSDGNIENVKALITSQNPPDPLYQGGTNEIGGQEAATSTPEEIVLEKLAKQDGYDLICDRIRNYNNNLPAWAEGLDYNSICTLDGELEMETAAVYCGQTKLSYNSPAGDYLVAVEANDTGALTAILQNSFTYLELTAYEADFTNIDYGAVKLNAEKLIEGDENFSTGDGLATVRNIGNTNLKIKVRQNDMGLGMSDLGWNILYRSKVGADANFTNYSPETDVLLENVLAIGQTSRMDFIILVYKFPEADATNYYGGNMVLGAEKVNN